MNTISNSKNSNSIHIPPGGDPRKKSSKHNLNNAAFFKKISRFLTISLIVKRGRAFIYFCV